MKKIFFREKLDIKLIVYHNADGDSARSMAEGKTTRIRLIGPKFVDFDPNSDTFTSNYTLDGTANDGVTFEKGPEIGGKTSGIPTDIQFTHGLKFADFVSINFTMSVDKDAIRPVGAGNMETAVVLHPLCIQNVFESYPNDNDTTYVSCGSLSSRPFISDSAGAFRIHNVVYKMLHTKFLLRKNIPFLNVIFIIITEKYDPIPIEGGLEECQVHASSQMDSNTKPFEATAEASNEIDKRGIIQVAHFTSMGLILQNIAKYFDVSFALIKISYICSLGTCAENWERMERVPFI